MEISSSMLSQAQALKRVSDRVAAAGGNWSDPNVIARAANSLFNINGQSIEARSVVTEPIPVGDEVNPEPSMDFKVAELLADLPLLKQVRDYLSEVLLSIQRILTQASFKAGENRRTIEMLKDAIVK